MKDKKSLAMIIIVGIMIVLFLCVNSKVFATTGTVVGDNLRVRKEENTTSEIIDLLDENDKVEILGENGDWYKVKANDKVGFVRKEFIKVQDGAVIDNQVANETTTEVTEERTDLTPAENGEVAQSTEKTEEQPVPEQPKDVKFNENVELKTMPLVNSIAINSTSADETYTVVCTAGSWAYVKSGNKEGWVLTEKSTAASATSETVTETENQEQQEEVKLPEDKMYSDSKTYYVKGSSVNVRNAASKDSDVVKVLNTNTEVEVVGEADTWYIVKVNGDKAYIAKSLLTTEKVEVTSRSSDSIDENNGSNESHEEESSSVPSNPIGSDVVAYAMKFEGYSYVYGTNGPNTFDCSGFVQYVYKHFGINLSRSSSTQANDGVYVSKSDLEPGDVLIFRDTSNSRIGHVGLYIGGGQFIHASNSRTGVIVSSLDTSAYQKRYVCARRIL